MMPRTAAMCIALAIAVGICLLVAALVVADVWSSSRDSVSLRDLRWQWAALSLLAMCAAVLTYAVCWWLLMGALERSPVAFAPAVQLFLLSWPGRYVPGSLPHYGGRLLAGGRAGLSRPAIAASLVYENLFAVAASGIVGAILLGAGSWGKVASSLWVAGAVVFAAIAAAALHPAVLRACLRLGARRVRRLRPLEEQVLPGAAVVRIGAAYLAGAVFAGCSFYFALCSVAGAGDVPVVLALAAYSIAGVAGLLAVGVPSGLGVREGVVVAILGAAVSPEAALAGAVLVRLVAVVVDFAPLALIAVWYGARRLFEAPTVRAPGAPPTRAR